MSKDGFESSGSKERIELLDWINTKQNKPLVLRFELVGLGAKLPNKERDSDAGIDIYTNIQEPVCLNPGDGYTFPTGISSEIPEGYAILIRDRSSLGSKLIGHLAGVIDSEYRGQWKITLINHGQLPYTVDPGDKICQGILTKVYDVDIRDVDKHPEENGSLSNSNRGDKGYGSSGK